MSLDGLVRVHFFDGRALDAATLRTEQRWVDTWARLLGRAAGPGVAFGLLPSSALSAAGRPGPEAELSPGLGFDARGAPVLVSAPLRFRWTALTLGPPPPEPAPAVGGTRFSGALPVTPPPPPPAEPVAPGLHLLWIAAEELPVAEGRTVDPRAIAGGGEVDAWRGGFRLSLRRVGDVAEDARNPWTRRGAFAAAALVDPALALADEGGLALALLEVGQAGEVVWLEPWVALREGRRGQGERIHAQFQAMIADLRAAGMPAGASLAAAGVATLPPYGALPIRVEAGQTAAALAAAGALLDGFNVALEGRLCPDDAAAIEAAAGLRDAPGLGAGARIGRTVRLYLPTGGAEALRFALAPSAEPLGAGEVPAPLWPVRLVGPLTWDQVSLGSLGDALSAFAPVEVSKVPVLRTRDAQGAWTAGSATEDQLRGWLFDGALALVGARSLGRLLGPSLAPKLLEEGEEGVTLADLARSPGWLDWVMGAARRAALEDAVRAMDLDGLAWALVGALRAQQQATSEATPLGLFVVGLQRDVESGTADDHEQRCQASLSTISGIMLLARLIGMDELTLLRRIAATVPFYEGLDFVLPLSRGPLLWAALPLDWRTTDRLGHLGPNPTGGASEPRLGEARAARARWQKLANDEDWVLVRQVLFHGALAALGERTMAGVGAASGRTANGAVQVKAAFLGAGDATLRARRSALAAALAGPPTLGAALAWVVTQAMGSSLSTTDGRWQLVVKILGDEASTILARVESLQLDLNISFYP